MPELFDYLQTNRQRMLDLGFPDYLFFAGRMLFWCSN